MMLNPRLLDRQNINEAEEEYILTLHHMREVLFEFESTLDPMCIDDLGVFRQIPEILEQLEFAMQRGWKFSQDHRSFGLGRTCNCYGRNY